MSSAHNEKTTCKAHRIKSPQLLLETNLSWERELNENGCREATG